ncbi:MAG: bifunctional aspartate kinase/homoserine dehydrogenase I, partial [Planctomycetota bacterium]|nr:bifunctional aspartate kinase/homoserine dehydrogenase I [Planctomycetota bacterium]
MTTRVMKFGGTSVGDAHRMKRVIDLVADAARTERVCLVASAVTGVTNLLVDAAKRVQEGDDPAPFVDKFRALHDQITRELEDDIGGDALMQLRGVVDELAREFERLLQGVSLLREASPLVTARVSSLGERVSCAILAEVARARGLQPRLLDAREFVIASGDALEATPDLEK